jgi:Flp pilus assembly protein TadB
MTTGLLLVAVGAAAGLGVVLVLIAVLPPAPVNLVAAFARLDALAERPALGPTNAGSWPARLVDRLAERAARSANRWWGAPLVELDLLERPVTGYIVRRLAGVAIGMGVLGLLALAAGLGPLAVPAALIGAIAGSLLPVAIMRRDAVAAREECRRAVAAYLDLVAQERAGGAAPTQALTEAAAVPQGWMFRKIRVALNKAVRTGITPWESLARLGIRFDVPALIELADIVSSAADGAAVYTTLTQKAAALRTAALTDDREQANRRSEKLVGPLACLLAGFVILIIYPMFARL